MKGHSSGWVGKGRKLRKGEERSGVKEEGCKRRRGAVKGGERVCKEVVVESRREMVVSDPVAWGGCLASSGAGAAGGHGTFTQGQAAPRRDGGVLRAALAIAGVMLLLSAVCFSVLAFGGGAPPSILASYDDVAHDDAVATISGSRHASHGGRLNAHSSIADFFNAAMNGDFEHGGRVSDDATDGLITGRVRVGIKAKAQYQSLAVHRLRAKVVVESKAARMAPAAAASSSQEHRQQSAGDAAHHGAAAHAAFPRRHTVGTVTEAAITRGLRGAEVQAEHHRGAAVAARQQVLAQPGGGVVLKHRRARHEGEGESKWKFPTEDKFVARYTGGIPQGDVLVDSFTAGPYVPL